MRGFCCRELRFPSRAEDNKMDERNRIYRSAVMMLFYLHLIVLFRFLLPSAARGDMQITFPDFSTEHNIMTVGDAAHNTNNRSYIFNAGATHSRGSFGGLLCKKKVLIQEKATGRVASFSTSFSFRFTNHGASSENSGNPSEGIGFSFAFTTQESFVGLQGFMPRVTPSGACNTYEIGPDFDLHLPGFAVSFVTDFNPRQKMPSNNVIRVYKNLDYEYDVAAYTHNLCANHTRCSYFHNGRVFTAWIDFNSSSHMLEVRVTNGSYPTVKKPLQPLLLIPNYLMPSALEDDVFASFWGSSTTSFVETHELLSWSFSSTGIPNFDILSSVSLLRSLTKATRSRITLGVFVVMCALAILGFITRVTRLSRYHSYAALDFSEGPHVFSYAELRRATAKFDEKNLLGAGGSGSVYRGDLEGPCGGRSVAVKQINFSQSKLGEALFQAEVSSLGQIRHRNVVQLLGWCQEKRRLLLVYDFMSNGGLDEWLHESGNHFQRQVLSLQLRHSILEGVGTALEYMHEDCQHVVLHRDIKSSNVLLDADFRAHLGDFGLARLMDHPKSDRTTLPAGTLGYMAPPEMPYTGKATKESDVYSFGMLVLEVVCGRRPLDLQVVEPEDLMLLNAVWRARESRSVLDVVDPRLLQTLQPSVVEPAQEIDSACVMSLLPGGSTSSDNSITPVRTTVDIDVEISKQMLVYLLYLGLSCCLPNPKARPSMGQVNCILQQIREVENHSHDGNVDMPPLPTSKPLGLYQSLEFSQTNSNLSPTSSTQSFVSLPDARTFVENASLQQGLASVHKDD